VTRLAAAVLIVAAAIAAVLAPSAPAAPPPLSADHSPVDTASSYGSGSFGQWTVDGFGLPAYRYDVDELTSPIAPQTELSGSVDAWSQVGKAFKFSMAGGPEQEYDEKKVEDLQEGLLEALKNATNIRNLKPDETLTVCVFGGASAGPRKARTVRASPKPAPDAPEEEVFVSIRDDGVPARGTIMTIRVKKSDADGFAKGELNADEFRKRASITTYAGDTGGWGGGNAFGGLAAP